MVNLVYLQCILYVFHSVFCVYLAIFLLYFMMYFRCIFDVFSFMDTKYGKDHVHNILCNNLPYYFATMWQRVGSNRDQMGYILGNSCFIKFNVTERSFALRASRVEDPYGV
jgi:hypothetical protein